MLLAFESVDRSGSLAVVDEAGVELHYRRFAEGRAAAELPAALDAALRSCEGVSRLAVAVGPGSFTGLRVGVVAARTLAWCEGLPLIGIDSMAAIAAVQGPGLWWVLMPLKRDTTFHACYRVTTDGRVEPVCGIAARADAAGTLTTPPPTGSIAIGPALAAKRGLAESWVPGIATGDAAGCDAIGVARIARHRPPSPLSEVVPAYHMPSAPELQRAAARS